MHLLESNLAVLHAIRTLQEAMSQAAPNGRDFYPQSRDDYGTARLEHATRERQTTALSADYIAIVNNIAEQIDAAEAINRNANRTGTPPTVPGCTVSEVGELGTVLSSVHVPYRP